MRKVLLESLLVGLAGLALAFLANAVSPRGLNLTRDYFGAKAPPLPAGTNSLPGTGPPGVDELAAQLEAKGLHLASSNQVLQLFQDPRRHQGLVLFIDAREEAHYQEGHIPDAYQLFYYNPGKNLGIVLPLCQVAEQIVIYCTGGKCEDSELTAMFLASGGIPKEKLLVYGGGITEWAANGLPVEIGERSSGQMRTNTR